MSITSVGDFKQLDPNGLAAWLRAEGVSNDIANSFLRRGVTGEEFMQISDIDLRNQGIPGGKVIVIRSKITRLKPSTDISVMTPGPGDRFGDVLCNYDCAKLRASTLEDALDRLGITQKSFVYKSVSESAKIAKKTHSLGPLTENEFMAIIAYTYDYGQDEMEKNLYYIVNKRLRNFTCSTPHSVDIYILHFLTALRHLKKYTLDKGEFLYRTVGNSDSIGTFTVGAEIEWKSFTSTSSVPSIAKSFFRSSTTNKHFFKIGGKFIGYSISEYSFLQGEKGNPIFFFLFFSFLWLFVLFWHLTFLLLLLLCVCVCAYRSLDRAILKVQSCGL